MQPNQPKLNEPTTCAGTAAACPAAATAELLLASVSEALEVMAFVIAEPAGAGGSAPPTEAPPADGDLLLTRVPIDGATAGTLDLICPAAFGGVLEANVGLENAPSDGIGAAGLRELGNVVCGLLIRRLREAGGGDAMIGLPDQEAFAPADWAAFARAPGAVVMDADGVRIAARVRQAKPSCGGKSSCSDKASCGGGGGGTTGREAA